MRPVQARRQGRQRLAAGRVMRDDGVAPQPRQEVPGAGAETSAGAAAGTAGPDYGPDIIAALAFCWPVLGAPTGKRLAPIMSELVPTLRRFDQLVISDDTEMALLAMSPATMDRRLAADRAKLVRGRPHTKRGRC